MDKAATRGRPARPGMLARWRGGAITLAAFVVVIAAWEVLVRALDVPSYVVPAPSGILVALGRGLDAGPTDLGGYYFHFAVTLYEALFGLFLGFVSGLAIGTLVSQIPFLERTLLPLIVAVMSVPKIALAPLFVVWFGLGLTSKIVMVVVITFFPLLINTIAGLKAADNEQIELLRSYSASKWQIFRIVKLPNALPFIFAGLNLAVILSILGAIVGEFVGGQYGLGSLILQMNTDLDMRGVFSVLVILSLMGLTLHYVVRKIQRRLLFWAPTERTMPGL